MKVVCSRRYELRLSDWLMRPKLLQDAGVQVLSTQACARIRCGWQPCTRLWPTPSTRIEANDTGAGARPGRQNPFGGGIRTFNIYNQPTLKWLASGCHARWVILLEMKRDDLAWLQKLTVRRVGDGSIWFRTDAAGVFLHAASRRAPQLTEGRLPLQLY